MSFGGRGFRNEYHKGLFLLVRRFGIKIKYWEAVIIVHFTRGHIGLRDRNVVLGMLTWGGNNTGR